MTGTPVVSNAGPLMALAKLNLLHLLKLLYGRVRFTPAVYSETVCEGVRQGYPDAHSLRLFLRQEAWTAEAIPRIPRDLASLPLDRGETESIALAVTVNGLLLIDEERGRAAARGRGIPVRGTLGILIEAYDRQIAQERRRTSAAACTGRGSRAAGTKEERDGTPLP